MKGKPIIITAAVLIAAAVALAGWSTGIYHTDGGDRMVVQSNGTIEYQSGATILNAIGAGTVGVSSTGLSLVESGDGVLHRTTFTLDGFEVAITDHTTAGAHGSFKLYDFPAGYLKFVGSSLDVDVSCGTTGLTATATYAFGVGTVTAGVDNAVLATTEQDMINAITGDLSGSAVALGSALATDASKDGHTTAGDAYFNVAFAADDASDDDVCTLDGTVSITWINLGDY